MTAAAAVAAFRRLIPCPWDDAVLAHWLSAVDGLIWSAFLKDKYPADPPPRYEDSLDAPLLVEDPYGMELYFNYLAARTYELSGETARYQNAMVRYNGALQAYVDARTRAKAPKGLRTVRL